MPPRRPGPRATREQRAVEREIQKLRGAIDSLKPDAPQTQTSPARRGSPEQQQGVLPGGTRLAFGEEAASPSPIPARTAATPPSPPTPPTALEATEYQASALDWSDLYRHTGGHCRWSPDGLFVAAAVAHRVTVRDAATMQIAQLFTCNDRVEALRWSPDSRYLLCGLYTRGPSTFSRSTFTHCNVGLAQSGGAQTRTGPSAPKIRSQRLL